MGQVNQSQNIDFLDISTAKAIENIQDIAAKRDYVFTISTSVENSNEIRIDRTTRFYRNESVWAEAEFYLYVKVTNAGGKDKANIHILTDAYGSLRIETPISFLEGYDENILYKTFGVRVTGKQHSETGEIDRGTLKFLELIDYHPKYDEKYLSSLRDKAKKSWLGNINPDEWLKQLRGGYDA